MSFSHFDQEGRAVMVDVSGKQPTLRTAMAEAKVRMRAETLEMIRAATATKGDVLGVARLAGIRGMTLIVNLPGSPKAALESLCAIWPAVPHTIEKIQGDTSDCGSEGAVPPG